MSERSGRFVLLLAFAPGLFVGCGSTATKPADDVAPRPASTSQKPTGPPWLMEVTSESGLDFTYRNGEEAKEFTILESLGGGVGLIDYDRDGLLDIVLPGGGGFEKQRILGYSTKIFRNLGDFRFKDITEETGLRHDELYTHGCAVADYDCDGWPDLLITSYQRVILLHNEDDGQGRRRFVETTEAAGLDDKLWSTSAGWGDVDGNKYPDLFVCHYVDWSFENHPVCSKSSGRHVCGPEKFQPLADTLYVNNGDGTFKDATKKFSIRDDGKGLGVVLVDLDDNGQPDIYVGNDQTPNFLYLNRGGRLEERGLSAGVALDEEGLTDASMGVDAADFNGSGRPALWVTNFERELHALYENLGNGLFQHRSKAAGLGAIGRQYVGFGTAFVDLENDGWEDLIIVNGHVFQHLAESTYRQKPVLLHNVEKGGRRFFDQINELGGEYFEKEQLGRGLAVGDLNNDGWPDVVASHSNTPVAILKNVAGESKSHRWLGVELVGRDQRDITGSTITLEVGPHKLTRFAKGGGSYMSSSDRRIVFGLGDADKPGRLTVRWSWGQTQHWDGLEANAYHRLIED